MSSLQKIAFTLIVCLFAAVCVGGVIAAETGVRSPAGAPPDCSGGVVYSLAPTYVPYTGIPVSSPSEPTDPNETTNLTVTRTALGAVTEHSPWGNQTHINDISPDRRHCASVFPTEDGQGIMLDGNTGKSYEQVEGQVFTPDSKHLGYRAEAEGKWFVVVDGKEGKPYDLIGRESPVFSPDSTRVAYTGISVASGQQACIVVDGVEGKWYPVVDKLVFSPDSKHVAYFTRIGPVVLGKPDIIVSGSIVVDDKEVRQFDDVGDFVFSPDSAHWACVIKVGKQYLVVQDGVDGQPYGWIIVPPIFSPDSKHMVYVAGSEGKWIVVLDGVESKKYESIEYGHIGAFPLQALQPVFSPDSQHLAYVAKEENKHFIVRDGVEGKQYSKSVSWPVFSPDSKHLAYYANDGDGDCIVQDGVDGTKYMTVKGLKYSPDSSRLAYGARTRDGWCVVVNNVEGKKYRGILPSSTHDTGIMFSADSKRMIYVAQPNDGQCVLVADGVEGKEYRGVSALAVSPDGNHVAYIASDGKRNFYVVDGTEICDPEEKPVNGLIFDSPTKCHGIVQRASTAYLIEIEIAPQGGLQESP